MQMSKLTIQIESPKDELLIMLNLTQTTTLLSNSTLASSSTHEIIIRLGTVERNQLEYLAPLFFFPQHSVNMKRMQMTYFLSILLHS